MGRRAWVAVGGTLAAGVALIVAFPPHDHGASSARQAAPLIGRIDDHVIPEGSGIIASRQHPGVFWTHSDSSNDPAIYAVTRTGRLLNTFPVAAGNADWEDIATDDAQHLYIADTGNNHGRRQVVRVLRLDEPDPSRPAYALRPDQVWQLKFPEAALNCESLFIHGGRGYLVSKVFGGQAAALYRFDLSPQNRPVVLEKVATLAVNSPVAAAAMSADGGRIALLSADALRIFEVEGEPARLGSAAPFRIPLIGPHRLEACCFAPDGLVVTAETGEIYLFADRPEGKPSPAAGAAPSVSRLAGGPGPVR